MYADANTAGLWKVYEKQDPYTSQIILSADASTANQEFGHKVVARNDGRTIVVSAPGKGQGQLSFLFRREATPGETFNVQSSPTMTDNNDNTSRLGESLSMSSDENFVVAGAPYTNTLSPDESTRFLNSGLVKVYIWNPSSFSYGILDTIKPPTDGSSSNENLNFGWEHKIAEPTLNSGRSSDKYLFISAPGHDSDQGRVYMYTWGVGADGSTYDTWTQNYTLEAPAGGTSQRFGHRLAVNDNGDILAVSSQAPGNAGKVEIFVRTSQANDGSTQHSFALAQTLTGVSLDGSSLNTDFGESLAMSKDGTTLIIGAPGVDSGIQTDAGAVYYYKWNVDGSTNTYTLQQTINAPDTEVNMRFGSQLDLNQDGTRLIISSENASNSREMKFDAGETTFDLQDTTVIDVNKNSGSVYTATMYDSLFVIDDRLITNNVSENDDFGKGVHVIDLSLIHI